MAAARDLPHPTEDWNDTEAFARSAGLRYVSDSAPGIRRKRAGKGFVYHDEESGKRVRHRDTLRRIEALVIPPAWSDVWICPHANGHLQATGRDARGRKQYRYHARWRKMRDETKYERMVPFGRALPRIRRRVDEDVQLPGLPPQRVIATVVHLLDETLLRVGNDEYARANRSYGLTTLQDRHAEPDVEGGVLHLEFSGKGGKHNAVSIDDPLLARIVAQTQALPGQDLFQYLDEQGEPRKVGSADVNEYLHEAAGDAYTAKEFRTWAGTVAAAVALREAGPCGTKTERKRNVTQAVKRVARHLRNTPAVCRRCYVHPDVLDAYLEGELCDALERAQGASSKWLDRDESAVLGFLESSAENGA